MTTSSIGSTGRVYNKRVVLDMLNGEGRNEVVIRDFVVRHLKDGVLPGNPHLETEHLVRISVG